MTNLIVQATPRSLTLVEVDSDLAGALSAKHAARDWVRVVQADARSVDASTLTAPERRPYVLLGNLPYYAASPIIRNFLESAAPPSRLIVMVQREVAESMAATPGQMSLMSIGVQLYASVEKLFDVPPAAFRPPPRVTSSVVRLTVLPAPRLELDSVPGFFGLVRAGFRAPRKQMRNSLALGLDLTGETAGSILATAGVDPSRRPATLSIEEWGAVYNAWRSSRPVVSGVGASGASFP